MVIIGVTDIHGEVGCIDRVKAELASADVVLVAGDLASFGAARRDAAPIVDAIRAHNANVLAVAGNCDDPDVEQYLLDEGIGLHGTHRVIDGVAFLGCGGSRRNWGATPNEHSEDVLAGFLDAAAAGLDPDMPAVLVCHQPPLGTAVDRVPSGQHVGSRAVRAFIETFKPLLCLSGHIHESVGTDRLGNTQLVNPGPLYDGGYAYAEVLDRVGAVDGVAAVEVRRV